MNTLRHPFKRRLQALGIIGLAWAASACAVEPPAPAPASAPRQSSSATLQSALQAEIGDALCDAPDQCHSLGVGAKPCGGPEAYVAWSSKRSRAETLLPLAEQHRAARQADNAREGIQSNCAMVMDPGASCVPVKPETKNSVDAANPGVCRLNSASRGVAAD